jgi:hypothetical protein
MVPDDDMLPALPLSVARTFMQEKGPTSSKKRRATTDINSSDGSEAEEETFTPSKKQQPKKTTEALLISSGSDSDSDIVASKDAKKTAYKGSVVPPRSFIPSSTSEIKSHALSDTSDDSLALPRAKPIQGRRGLFQQKRYFQSSLSSIPGTKEVDDSDDDDDDDPIISSPRRSQKPVFRSNKDSTEDEEEEDIKSSPRRRSRPTNQSDVDDDEDEEDIVSPLKRKRTAVESDSDVRSPLKRQRNAQPSEDSDSDLPSPSRLRRREKSETPSRLTRQTRTRKHRTEKEKTFELLRRKRAGENISELTDTSESDSDDEEPQFEKLSEFEDDEEEEEAPQPKRQATKRTLNLDENADADADPDDDFIVEDDEDDPLGVPSFSSIPLEFTHQAHKPLKAHFKDAVEWMVHKKINPAFARDDPVYEQAFRKLQTECDTLAKSKFSSTQWTRDFTKALYARPLFVTGPLEDGEGYDLQSGQPKCDACNHRSHIPSAFIQFQGKAYVQRTLDEVEQEEEEDSGSDKDSEDDSDHVSVNADGQEIPSQRTKWFVGRWVFPNLTHNCQLIYSSNCRHCFANAEQAHTLVHWKFALYEWVKDTLENEGELRLEKLAKREKMKAKRRTAYANALVDRWESENQIKDLYRDFKTQISTARDMKAGARGGWK